MEVLKAESIGREINAQEYLADIVSEERQGDYLTGLVLQ